MKKILSTFLLAATMAAGCDSPDVRYDIPTPPDTMHLEVSSESVVLDPSRKDSEAVRFTWDAAAMRGESLTYYFKMDVEENNFATSIDKIAIAEGERSISFTHKQMNDLLARWGVEPGDRTSLVAEVIAESTNNAVYQKPEISRVVFEVRSYTTKLFLCGSATAAGDDVAQALQMHEVIAGQTYEWSGRLEEGGIWFPLSQETALPAYGRGEDDSMLAYYEEGEVEPVRIAGPGYYSVTVDVDARSIAVRETVYLVGSGCAAGWRPQDALAMTQPDPTKRVFVWRGMLFGEEFNRVGDNDKIEFNQTAIKFPLFRPASLKWEIPMLMAPEEGTEAAGTTAAVFVENNAEAEDRKWKVSQTGVYTVTVDLDAQTVTFEREEVECLDKLPYRRVWMVGGATSGGWNSAPFEIELTYDAAAAPGTFVFEGPLKDGEFKFPLWPATYSSSNPFLRPATCDLSDTQASLQVTGMQMHAGDPDEKWTISADEAGNYRITLNVDTMTIRFEKQ